MSAVVNWDHFCCRCQSELGWEPDRPHFCVVCWKDRVRVPRELLLEIEELRRFVIVQSRTIVRLAKAPA